MSDRNLKFRQRRSIRLKGYDYSKAGLYFITICTQNHECLYGKIDESKMVLNDAGRMIEKWYFEMENKYPDVYCREMIIMPNHFHCILELTRKQTELDAHAGAPLCGRPELGECGRPETDECGRPETDECGHPETDECGHPETDECGHPELGDHIGSPQQRYGPENKKYGATIGEIIDWFKAMTTNEYIRGVKNLGWKRFNKKLWQRNYWDRIIRDENAYCTIANYIENNPSAWKSDKQNPDHDS